jgi:hypothetical protein
LDLAGWVRVAYPGAVSALRAGAIRTPLWDPVPEPQRAALFEALAGQTLTNSIGEANQIAAAHVYRVASSPPGPDTFA